MIREYRPEDAAQLEARNVELQDFQRRIDPYQLDGQTLAPRYVAYMFERCAETDGKVFVAELDGQVVGFISVWAKVKATAIEEEAYEFAYVSDLAVMPDYRGRGIGKALLRAAEDYAVEQGATILRLGVLAKNEVARKLYHDYGFEERIIALTKNLRAKDERGT